MFAVMLEQLQSQDLSAAQADAPAEAAASPPAEGSKPHGHGRRLLPADLPPDRWQPQA